MSIVKIIQWNCYTERGSHYHQFDLVIDGVADIGWCDSLVEAMDEAAKIPGVDMTAVVIEQGGDLPEERY